MAQKVTEPTLLPQERAFLIGVEIFGQDGLLSLTDSLAELELLAETAGLHVVGEASQKLKHPNTKTFIGSGKVNEVQALVEECQADVVLFDPTIQWTMGQANSHSCNDWHAYEGIEVTGKIQKVFSRGELIIDGEECLAEKGRGHYLHRKLDVN